MLNAFVFPLRYDPKPYKLNKISEDTIRINIHIYLADVFNRWQLSSRIIILGLQLY